MATTSVRSGPLAPRPLNRWSPLDTAPRRVAVLARATPQELVAGGLSTTTAQRLLDERRRLGRFSLGDLGGLAGLPREEVDRVRRGVLLDGDTRLALTDVAPAEGRIMSGRPFTLRLHLAFTEASRPVLASVAVEWAGEPFVVETRITPAQLRAGHVDVRFDRRRTLPTGPATFRATVYAASGAAARFRTTCAVLPSNPFALSVAPNNEFVTGSWSARGFKTGGNYETDVKLTLSNGDGSAVAMTGGFTWKFWDGGVGGTLIEQGTDSFGPFSVAGHDTWVGFVAFTSPPGSGVYSTYAGREDMTLEIIMNRSSGGTVSGTITCRTMFVFGINVTKVSFEGFTGAETTDLHAAYEVTRSIYERRDLTTTRDWRGIHHADAGGYEIITTDGEAHDLWDDWSGPDSNHNIDMFVVQSVAIPISGDGTADGIDGSIPGPTSHHGSNSGTIASKSGYVDAGGHARLHVEYLGMLMGHELGHYLGLVHVSDAGNLMLPSSGTTDTNLTYDQYRTMIRHGWVSID